MDKEKKLKRKLFIGGAYLVVALLLLIYVSYSAYRIKITATVQMPEALAQKASLYIEYDQEKGKIRDTSDIVLNDLMPNEKVSTYKGMKYASASQLGRAIKFTVSNAEFINETGTDIGKPGGENSKLKMQYKLKLTETGVVPLDCILVDSNNKEYTLTTTDVYNKRGDYFKSNNKEAVFSLDSNALDTQEFTLYVGWNNTKNNSEAVYDSSRKKEIASIEIRAEVTQSIREATASQATPSVEYYYTDVKPTFASVSQASPSE